MRTSLRLVDYLGHILQAIKRIGRHVSDVDVIHFLESELLQDAVIRNIEIIGEAANTIWRTYPEFAAAHSEIPWEAMYTMRNRVSHGYHQVDLDIFWKTINEDLPELYAQIALAREQT